VCKVLINESVQLQLEQAEDGDTTRADAIMRTDLEHWSRAWFKIGSFCDSVGNNMCECFNHWILKARFVPIICMLEGIRRQVLVRIQENRSKTERWNGPICPNTYKKLMTYITASGYSMLLAMATTALK
jgi:hypothetical protein